MFVDQGLHAARHVSKELMQEGLDGMAIPAEPIDLKHLGRFTYGDADLEHEVLGLFAGQVPLTIEALKTAASEKDWQMAAHTLKGSGRAVGAWRLADLAVQAERIGGLSDRTTRARIVSQIEAAAAEVAGFIRGLPSPQMR
jgi:HPt (histidine-containing phosphotransfer) domain-containing protein